MIVLDTQYAQQRTNSKPTTIVGFRDGHRLITDSIDMNSDDLILELLGGTTLASPSFVRPVEERVVQFIQPIGHKIVYVSDLKPSGYKHIPYLSGHWPFQADRDLQMRMLGSDQLRSAKGIAMHSASRLTFELNEGFTSFDSELVIADSETKGGSVVYRVFVRRSAQWTEAYKSPIVRLGDQPLLCSVPIHNADAISLVVDFADRADQGDHALWLDARLLRQ
jgi:hypothetical protein